MLTRPSQGYTLPNIGESWGLPNLCKDKKAESRHEKSLGIKRL
jgi:hypothetical protein